jgi:excisionase family DNA binding protein
LAGKPLTTLEAAERLGVTDRQVRLYIQSGRLEAEPFGRAWLIAEKALEKFTQPPKGRPRKRVRSDGR